MLLEIVKDVTAPNPWEAQVNVGALGDTELAYSHNHLAPHSRNLVE